MLLYLRGVNGSLQNNFLSIEMHLMILFFCLAKRIFMICTPMGTGKTLLDNHTYLYKAIKEKTMRTVFFTFVNITPLHIAT